MDILGILIIIGFLGFLFYKFRDKPKKKEPIGKEPKSETNNPSIIKINSFSGSDQYAVNIDSITCTCPDFTDRRSQFGRDDPRRLCKHLIRGLLKEGELPSSMNKYCEKIQGIDDEGRGFPLTKRLIKPVINTVEYEIWLCSNRDLNDPKYAWCDVYWGEQRFSYSIAEHRWSYQEKPGDHESISRLIHAELNLPAPDVKYTIAKNKRKIYNQKKKEP